MMFTVRVRNYKDDLTGESATNHGAFPTADAAKTFADEVSEDYVDFLTADVVPLLPATLDAVRRAHGIRD